jgi:hypothetical protein
MERATLCRIYSIFPDKTLHSFYLHFVLSALSTRPMPAGPCMYAYALTQMTQPDIGSVSNMRCSCV